MRSGNGTGGTTVFDSLKASFAIADGQMHNNDLKMKMPLAQATGQGRIGLGTQDLDYTFTPELLAGDNTRGLGDSRTYSRPLGKPALYTRCRESA